jgi:hypothetical protein
MPRLKQKALSNPPSQPTEEGGLDSAPPLTGNTVAIAVTSLNCRSSASTLEDFCGESSVRTQ